MIVRHATVADAPAIGQVQVASWRTTYPGIIPQSFLDKMDADHRGQIWHDFIEQGKLMLVLEEKNTVIGFACGGAQRDVAYSDYDGELYAIYLLKEVQHAGGGQALIEAIMNELLRQGFTRMTTAVVSTNLPAVAFYEKLGGKLISETHFDLIGELIPERIYGWDQLESRAVQ